MPNIGQLHVDFNQNFNGFMQVHLVFDISVSIDDAHTQLTATITNNRSTYSLGPRTSWGFINFGGLIWDGPAFDATGPTLGRPEDWNSVMGQMAQLSGWQIPDNVAWGIYASDNNPPTYQGTIATKTTFTKALSASDFDADGNIKDFALVRYGSRWYSSGEGGHPVGQAVVNSGNDFTIHLSDLVSDYFPWAVWQSNWMSCNRQGGSVQRRSGNWTDAKNSSSIEDSHVFHHAGGWQISPKTGQE